LSRLAPLDKALVLILVPLWVVFFILAVKVQFEVRGMAPVEVPVADADSYPTLTGMFLPEFYATDPLAAAGLRADDRVIHLGEVDMRGIGFLDFQARVVERAEPGSTVAVDPTLDEVANWDALRETRDDDDLAVEFTRLFDVGAGAPPCPLHGGLYFGNRMKTMEEAVRFYNFFGLTLSDTQRELPDHLTTQLEFLHFLAFREAETLEEGTDPGSWQQAQRDFVARHPGRWVPELRKKLEAEKPMPFFRELFCRLASFLEGEPLYLASATSDS